MINDENNEKDYSSYLPSEGDANAAGNEEQTELPTEKVIEPEAATNSYGFERTNSELTWVAEKVNQVRSTMGEYIIGQSEMVELMLIGVFSNGHILLEGAPGVAKTLASKVMAKALKIDFSRIQFTPDLMPSDVIGTSIFNMQKSEFSFKKGPVFANLVLIDEINRAPAKTQAALFEVMEERQITYDGECYTMSFPFLVIATQNPIDQEGTYNLPEAQLDRFLFKVKLGYPDLSEEEEILQRYKNNIKAPELTSIQPSFTPEEIKKVQEVVQGIVVENNLLSYIAQIVHKTRNHGKIYLGASPRASLSILKAAKATAAIRGRDFITPEDVQFVAVHVLNHRLILTPEAEMEGIYTEDLIKEIIESIEVPR